MKGRKSVRLYCGSVDCGRPSDPASFRKAIRLAKEAALASPGMLFVIAEVTIRRFRNREWVWETAIDAVRPIAEVRYHLQMMAEGA